MIAHTSIAILGALLCTALHSPAGEKITLVAESQPLQFGYSEPLTLNQGESAELTYATSSVTLNVTVGGKTFDLSATTSTASRPITVAGPAIVKMQVGGLNDTSGRMSFVTFDVTRTGTASNPTPIPQEAGTTWQVILEASADLVNWTAVAPGDYPSSTPQRYFRTRLVKRS